MTPVIRLIVRLPGGRNILPQTHRPGNFTSEHRLLEEVRAHLAYRWFTRLSFEKRLPSRRTDTGAFARCCREVVEGDRRQERMPAEKVVPSTARFYPSTRPTSKRSRCDCERGLKMVGPTRHEPGERCAFRLCGHWFRSHMSSQTPAPGPSCLFSTASIRIRPPTPHMEQRIPTSARPDCGPDFASYTMFTTFTTFTLELI
jgi:hypothetical protein